MGFVNATSFRCRLLGRFGGASGDEECRAPGNGNLQNLPEQSATQERRNRRERRYTNPPAFVVRAPGPCCGAETAICSLLLSFVKIQMDIC